MASNIFLIETNAVKTLPELEARVVLDQSVREKFFDLAEAAGDNSDWD